MSFPQKKKCSVAVVYDGALEERTQLHRVGHEISTGHEFFESAGDSAQVAKALKRLGHRVTLHSIGRNAAQEISKIPSSCDVVFNLCDTVASESRLALAVPTLLEARKTNYVGADQFGLAITKRKHDVKAILDREKLATPRYQVVADLNQLKSFELNLEAPVIVKLTQEHSSIGIESASVCFTHTETKKRIALMLKRHQQPILIEEYVHGREFYVSFYGRPARALPLMEHSFEKIPPGQPHVRGFDFKWFGQNEKKQIKRDFSHVPLRKPSVTTSANLDSLEADCRRAFDACGCRDWGRIDLRLDRSGVPMIIDVTPNTYLGISSPCAVAAKQAGIEYDEFVGQILQGALMNSPNSRGA